jgi:hypothetical protein
VSAESPELAFERLKSECVSKRAHRNLENVHKICAELVSGGMTITPSRVGRKTQALGGPSLNTLYSPGGARFRRLMNAWDRKSSPKSQEPREEWTDDDQAAELISAIQDPAIRSLVGIQRAEMRRLRRQITDLRSATSLTIDLRPAVNQTPTESIWPKSDLLPTERDALKTFAEMKWLSLAGWTEGTRGEALCNGKEILSIGTLTGLRKLLGRSIKAGLRIEE